MQTERSYWVHDIDPVIWQISDSLAIRWYGLAYIAAFVVAWVLMGLYMRRGRVEIGAEQREQYFLWMLVGVVVGGRLGYMLLYDADNWLRDPLQLVRVWQGGMASHGGFIGVAIASAVLARKWGMPVLRLWDICASLTAIGLGIGRLANFINGELWGKVSYVSWAMIFPDSGRAGVPVEMIEPRHPSQLYQAGLEGFLLFGYIQWRFWRSDILQRPGQLCGEFLIGYALMRSLGEVFREPDATLILGLSRGTFYSLFLLAVGIGLLVRGLAISRKGKTVRT